MSAVRVSALALMALTIGAFLLSSLDGSSTHVRRGTRRRAQGVVQPADLDAQMELLQSNELYQDKWSLNPRLIADMVAARPPELTDDPDDEPSLFAAKQAYQQDMEAYHSRMSPCLHKRMWQMIGLLNPRLTEEIVPATEAPTATATTEESVVTEGQRTAFGGSRP